MTTTPPLVVSRNPADPTETVAQVQAAGAFGAADAVERARAAMYFWCHGHFTAGGDEPPYLVLRLTD
ncbi:hypothetical protein ABT039_39960, partial [Streptomyces lasiicapitis]